VSVAFAHGLFVLTGGTPSATERFGFILTSPDGLTWTTRVNGATRVNQATYGNGTWVAVDDTGGRWTSLDGLTWSFGFTSRTGYLRGLAYGAPAFVTTGVTGLQSSYDGISWINPVPGAGQIEGLAYGRGRFIAVGTIGLAGTTYASRDGVTWTQQATTTDLSARGIVYFNNRFVVTGTAITDGGGLATSFDGTAWTPRPTGVTAGTILLAIGSSPTSALVVGTGGTILQSPASATAPSVAVQPAPVIEAVGGHVAFSVTARGSLPLTYQWRRDAVPLEGATDDTLFLSAVSLADSALYSCVVTNPAGVAITADAALTVVTTFPPADPVDTTFTLGPSLSVAPRVAAVQPDGKILLGGNFLLLNEGQPQFGLARLHPDGALDTTFKPGSLNPGGLVTSLAVKSDGKILVGGSFTTVTGIARPNLARLHADGALDDAFVPLPAPSEVSQVAASTDARVYATSAGLLLRYHTSGAADSTLAAGIAQQRFDLSPDGKIVIATFATGTGSQLLVRLHPDGTRDPDFTPQSISNFNAEVRALKVLPDGRIMVAAAGAEPTVRRYTSAGLFEASFPLTFFAQILPPTNALTAAAFTPDGRTWLAGNFFSLNGIGRYQLARLNTDGSVDATFNPGTAVTATNGSTLGLNSLVALEDGRALATGDFTSINGVARPQVARLNAQSFGGANLPAIVNFARLYREIRAGEPLTIPVTAAGSAQLVYRYRDPNGRFGSVSGNNSLTIPAGTATLSGAYTVLAANSVGTSPPQTFFVRIIPSAPFITQQPAPLQTNVGRPITLVASFGGSAGNSYQWFKNGTALTGTSAASDILSIPRAAVADSGDYTLVARNSLGFASSATVHVGVDETSRFINLATRGRVGAGDAPLIVGFVAAGPGHKRVMLRAAGPTLGSFGVPATLANPAMRVFNAAGALIYTNDDWAQANDVPGIGNADTRLGAFQLNGGSAAAAGILTLAPGAYSAVITGQSAAGTETSGVALAEIYEDDTASSRLVNLSSRGFVSPGASVMIPAFVTNTLATPTPKKLLIRGLGPALTAFGVTGALANPTLSIIDSAGRTVATNDDWEQNTNLTDLRAVTAQLAFPLTAGSRDAALLITLAPGAYTCTVSGVNNTTGTALVEVYEVP